MRIILFIAILMGMMPGAASAQDGNTPGPAQRDSSGDAFDLTPENEPSPPPKVRPEYQLTRWLEDWRVVADPAKRTDVFDPVKYIALDPYGNAHLTLSGQWREDVIANNGSLFGKRGDTYGLHRIYLGADLHMGQARIYGELANTLPVGLRGTPSPTDKNELDLQLLFADYRFDLGGGAELIGRLGRQELAFDPTQRFVGVREGPNNRQAFDAARINLKANDFYISAFASRPVVYNPGIFDDVRNEAVDFSGIYATHASLGQTQSLYLYNYGNHDARFGNTVGRERRTSVGARVAGRFGEFDYDIEGMGQTGSFDNRRISAWGIGSLAGYTFDTLPWSPRIGIQADFASGDRNSSDDRITTFNPLFFKGGYFLEAPISTFSNVQHLKASLSFKPQEATTVSLSYGEFAKMTLGDAVYANPLVALPQTREMTGRRVGNYLQFLVSHQVNQHFSLSFEFDHFKASSALRAVGGNDIDYAKLTANFIF